MKRIVLSFCLLSLAAVAQAQNFRWVDKDGKVQYGDNPPPGVKSTPLKAPPGPATQPSSPASKDAGKDGKDAKKALTPEEAFRKRQEDAKKAEAKAAEDAANAAKKKQNCTNAQARLRDLESGTRIAQTNAQGERVFMDDATRATETASARKSVQEWCK